MSLNEEIAAIIGGDTSRDEKITALKKLGLRKYDIENLMSEPRQKKKLKKNVYAPAPFHADNVYKTLSVRQPWASLCCTVKDVENRSYPTRYRGKLLIHASQTLDRVMDEQWMQN